MSKIKGIEPVVGHAHTRAVPLAQDPEITKLKKTLLKDIRRSAYVYRVDCGGCNACEIEIFATITPLFDAERFGIKVVASPPRRHPALYRRGDPGDAGTSPARLRGGARSQDLHRLWRLRL